MHRIDAAGHSNNQFVDKNPATGTAGTIVDADWLNAFQESIVRVVEGGGEALVKGDNNQLLDRVMPHVNGNTTLRGITPAVGRRIYRKYHTAEGDGGALMMRGVTGAPAGTYVDNDGTIIVPTNGDGSAAWVSEELLLRVEQFGADLSALSDSLAAFQSAATQAGQDGVVKITGSLLLDGVRPRLQDYPCIIEAEPDAIINCDLNPNVKELAFATPLKTTNPVDPAKAHTFERNYQRDETLLTAAAAVAQEVGRYTAVNGDFTADYTQNTVTGAGALSAGTATVTAASVSWAVPFGSGQEGVLKDAIEGTHYEVTFIRDNSATGTPEASYVSAEIICAANRFWLAFREEDLSAKLFRHDGAITTTLASITLSSLQYTINANASVTLGIRQVSATVFELYANDLLVYRFDTNDYADAPSTIGFCVTAEISGKVSIEYPQQIGVAYRQQSLNSDVSIAVIGDSISYGAWSSIDWPTHLKNMLTVTPGYGNVAIRNRAVSGSSARTWVTGGTYVGDGGETNYDISTEDFSGDDYVCVMLGTNDAMVYNDVAQYQADIVTIANKIIADGAKPIFGLFPHASDQQPGFDGFAMYVAALKTTCSANGYAMANVRDAFGYSVANDGWLFDTVHPHEKGQVQIAKSFYHALNNDTRATGERCQPVRYSADTDWVTLTSFTNSWVDASAGDSGRVPSYKIKNGMVYLHGLISSGALNVSALILPEHIKPTVDVFGTVANKDGSTYYDATVYVTDAGAVQVLRASQTGAHWVSLDTVSWPLP